MSLAGNLEDLGVGDIVQIVNLNQKSGVLFLRDKDREGLVVFRQGQVVRARSTCQERYIGEIMVEKGLVEETKLQAALLLQQQNGFKDRLGSILINEFSVEPRAVEAVARDQIQEIMRGLFSWQSGPFIFELDDDPDTAHDVKVNPLPLIVEHRAGTRNVKRQHRSGAVQGSDAPEKALMEYAAGIRKKPRRAVVVDDDRTILEHLAAFLTESRWKVESFFRCADALIAIDGMYRTGERPSVVIDLFMPRLDGTGILGGIELIELLHRDFVDLPVLAIADYHNVETERKIKSMGYSFLRKPGRGDLADSGSIRFFSSRLLQELERRVASEDEPSAPLDAGGVVTGDGRAEPVAAVRNADIATLRRMLYDLNNPDREEGIIPLVVRLAAEYMSRVVLFSVDEHEITGLGYCACGSVEVPADFDVHKLRVPRSTPSVLMKALQSSHSIREIPDDSDWNVDFFRHLGGTPSEVFLGPIVCGGTTVAILYGDSFPGEHSLGNTDILEIFLSQAGMAMETALSERKLKDIPAEAL